MQIYPYSTTYFCSMEILRIAIIAEEDAFSELAGMTDVEWKRMENTDELSSATGADVLMYLKEDLPAPGISHVSIPVILNSVITPLHELGLTGEVIRINAWPGFLQRNLWEYSGNKGSALSAVLEKLGKKTVSVADEAGLVTARVIAMIINEAYFALGEKVSTREEIDIALKLGTNYPYGPFEWSRKIGVQRIYRLLEYLSKTDNKYTPSPLLYREAQD